MEVRIDLKKLELYQQCRVKEYWTVDPKNNLVDIYIFDNNEITDNLAFHKGAHEYAESVYFSELKVVLKDVFL